MDAPADPATPRRRTWLDAAAALSSGMVRGELSRATRARLTAVIALIGILLAAATAWVLGQSAEGLSPTGWPRQGLQRAVLLADLVYLLALAGLVVLRVAALVSARRARSAGSRLHLRLAAVFAIMALAPTILVAVFATITVSYGIEGWFSQQVGTVVRNSLVTAQSYEQEHRRRITSEIAAMASVLNRHGARGITDPLLGEVLRREASDRGFPLAYVFDSNLNLVVRGEFSYLFSFVPPTPDEMQAARDGNIVVFSDFDDSEIRALVYLAEFFDYYLLVARRVDGDVLSLLDETQDTVQLYERLEQSRDSILLEFAFLYVGFALVVTLAATWAGLWFAERLARPVGRLAGAAQRVGAGDLDVRVKEQRGDDEIAVLSRVFNRMTRQVKGQRDALVAMNQQTEARRRFTETVLAGVTAGVARLDADGRIELLNEAGAGLLGLAPADALGRRLSDAAPLFEDLFAEARRRRSGLATDRIHGALGGREHDFLARIARTPGEPDAADAYVLTFDDMTDLVAAQRMAAWGDIARRIAHEIKNPLTPIQLSAERLKSKFAKGLEGRDKERFDGYADMIVRQAGEIGRMVDEFSRFARMPAPELADEDLVEVLREAVLLQAAADTPVAFEADLPDAPRLARLDRGMITQALTNLLKNAGESVEARLAERPEPPGRVRAVLTHEPDAVVVRIIDNGLGLPVHGRSRLLEPYVTTREKGTGLGLAITRKIAEEHGGALTLEDAPPDPDGPEGAPRGAMAVLRLPAAPLPPDPA